MRKSRVLAAVLMAAAISAGVVQAAVPVPHKTDASILDLTPGLAGDVSELHQLIQTKSPVRYKLLVIKDTEGEDPTAYLDRVAAQWGAPEADQLLLVVFAGLNHDIRFFMGTNFRAAGVTVDEMVGLVRSAYFPEVRKGNPAGGLTALIRAVNLRMGAGTTSDSQVPAELSRLTPTEALAKSSWSTPERAMACTGTPAAGEGTWPVLACQWGPGMNALFDGRALYWFEGGAWKAYTYPAEAVRGVGYFRELQWAGEDLLVVMNTAGGQTAYTEEPQVLRRAGAGWRLLWQPQAGEWPVHNARVQYDSANDRITAVTTSLDLPEMAGGLFTETPLSYRIFLEDWERQGEAYVKLGERSELKSPYSSLWHFFTAIAAGKAEEAAQWAAGPEVVERALQFGLRELASKGIKLEAHEQSKTEFLVTDTHSGQSQWQVTLEFRPDGWYVAEIK